MRPQRRKIRIKNSGFSVPSVVRFLTILTYEKGGKDEEDLSPDDSSYGGLGMQGD